MGQTKIAQTREQLHELIDHVDDENLLELYLQLLLKHSQQAVFEPTNEEVQAVQEGLDSIKLNGTISHKEAVERLRAKYPNLSFQV